MSVANLEACLVTVQGSSEVSEEDYKRIHAARKQHEMEMQAQARRELRAARRKASAERAASERAKQQLETPELAASSAPAIASRSDTRPGQYHVYSVNVSTKWPFTCAGQGMPWCS